MDIEALKKQIAEKSLELKAKAQSESGHTVVYGPGEEKLQIHER